MKHIEYELLPLKINNTNQALKGKDIFYKCTNCGGIVSSFTKENIGCNCGNIFIDVDYFRLAVKDFSQFQILKKVS